MLQLLNLTRTDVSQPHSSQLRSWHWQSLQRLVELLNGKLTKAKLQPPWAQLWQLPSPLQADGLLLAGHTTVLGAAVLSCSFHNPIERTMKPAPGGTGSGQRPTPHIWRWTEACATRTPIFSIPFPFQAAVTQNCTTLPRSYNTACESTASHPICSPNALSAKLAGKEPPTDRPAINHRKHCAEASRNKPTCSVGGHRRTPRCWGQEEARSSCASAPSPPPASSCRSRGPQNLLGHASRSCFTTGDFHTLMWPGHIKKVADYRNWEYSKLLITSEKQKHTLVVIYSQLSLTEIYNTGFLSSS